MEKLVDLQDEIQLKICQIKCRLASSSTSDVLKQTIEDKLTLLEKEMAYYATYNNLDISDTILIEWLEKYHEIANNLLMTSKTII